MTPRVEIPGADIVDMKPPKACNKCGGEIIVAQVLYRPADYKWHNLDRQPIERDGRRVYLRHVHRR